MTIEKTVKVDYAEKLAFVKTHKDGIWSHRDCLVAAKTNPGYCDFVLFDGAMVRGTSDCKGTGLVYLFPDESGVRVKCGGGHIFIVSDAIHSVVSNRPCEEVGCPGYTALNPMTGGDTWAQAVWPLLDSYLSQGRGLTDAFGDAYNDYFLERARGNSPAALEFAYRALVAAGMIVETA